MAICFGLYWLADRLYSDDDIDRINHAKFCKTCVYTDACLTSDYSWCEDYKRYDEC